VTQVQPEEAVAKCVGLNQRCHAKKPGIGRWRKCCRGTRCKAGRCRANACRIATGLTYCAGHCVDLLQDSNNCGDCGIACAPGWFCCKGSCCPAGTTCCDGRCCPINQTCCRGVCCGSGEFCCADGTCSCGGGCCTGGTTCCYRDNRFLCTDLSSNPNHCGRCHNVCPTGENGQPRPCQNGVCDNSCIAPSGLCESEGLPCCETDSQVYACQLRVSDGGHACQPLCAKYGTACRNAASCCDDIPCTGGLCRFN
jgi:hypothetical protein